MDVAQIARLKGVPPTVKLGTSGKGKATFEMTGMLKGNDGLGGIGSVDTLDFGGAKAGDPFLVMRVDSPKIAWSTPLPVSGTPVTSLRRLQSVPEKGPKRLALFLPHLEHEDELLSKDASAEFAGASYAEMRALREMLDHGAVAAKVQQADLAANHQAGGIHARQGRCLGSFPHWNGQSRFFSAAIRCEPLGEFVRILGNCHCFKVRPMANSGRCGQALTPAGSPLVVLFAERFLASLPFFLTRSLSKD